MTLLVRNVRIIGGARRFSAPCDVFVQGDTISAIGSFPTKKADEIIDGQGNYLAPGFIDVNTDSDHYLTLFDNPTQDDFLKQGVTTILGGMCGASLAPLLYGSLESIQKWGDVRCINVGWHTISEFLRVLEARGLGVNFGTLVGHSTIRRALVGESIRNLTKNEMKVFRAMLARALAEGGFGFSSGLGYVHSRTTPYAELKALAEIVRAAGGVYATHLRNGCEELADSIKETLKLNKETGVKTLISHFMPFRGAEEQYRAALAAFGKLSPDRTVLFDAYPFDMSVVPLYTLLPLWAQEKNSETMVAHLGDSWKRKRILKELPQMDGDALIVAFAPRNEVLVGKNLEALREIFGAHSPVDALLALMRTTSLRAVVFYRNIATELIPRALAHPRALIATNAASIRAGSSVRMQKPERAARTFTKFLNMAQGEGLMPLESAIKKITKIPAELFNIQKRGEIREGNFADLVCFAFKEGSAPPDEPTEIRFVVVNGTLAVRNGEALGALKGKVLRHTTHTA